MEQTENKRELLTVSQFASRLGVSTQAVYKRLQTALKGFVVKVGNRIMIDAAALDAQEIQPTVTNKTNQNQPTDNQQQPTVANPLVQVVSEQRETIERLTKELEEARADIRRKDEQIEAMTARLLNITEKQQELLYNSQVLQGQAQKKGFFARLFAPKQKENN